MKKMTDPYGYSPISFETAKRDFASAVVGVVDSLQEPLYDYLTYPAAGTTNLQFFATGIGGAKTVQDTNMSLNGQLGNGESFLVQMIAVDFLIDPADFLVAADPDRASRQYAQVMEGRASLTFRVGVNVIKVQQSPLKKFPMPSELEGCFSVSTTLNATTEGASFMKAMGRPFIPTPISIQSGQPFSVAVDFAAAIPISNPARMGINLYGTRYRNAA